MDKILLKKAAIQSVALMLAVITISFALRQNQVITISASGIINDLSTPYLEEQKNAATNENSSDELQPEELSKQPTLNENFENNGTKLNVFPQTIHYIENNIYDQLGERFLIIRKPEYENIELTLEDLYITKSIRIVLSGLKQEDINSSSIGRVNGTNTYYGEPVYTEFTTIEEADGKKKTVQTRDYGKDLIHAINITKQPINKDGVYSSELIIELDHVYTHMVYEDENYFYIALKNVKEVYDRVLVIDAGHGGKDGGALSKDGKVLEKDINVQILLELKELLDKEKIKVYYTRLGDDKIFLRPRVELANVVDCDFFISIHCNASEASWPNGSEVLYYDTKVKHIKIEELANIFSEELAKTTTLDNRGLVKKHNDDIFILENAVVPAVLVEVGYITNSKDVNYLIQSENRKTVAQGIYNGIMRAYSQFSPITENR